MSLLRQWRSIVSSNQCERRPISLNDLHNVAQMQASEIAYAVVTLGIREAHQLHHRGKAVSLDSLALVGPTLSHAQRLQVEAINGSGDPCWWEFSSYKAYTAFLAERRQHNNRERNRKWYAKKRSKRQRLS